MSHVISGNDTEHLINCLYFTDNIIVVTDRTSLDMNSGEVKVIKFEESDTRKSFGYRFSDNIKFPLLCCYTIYTILSYQKVEIYLCRRGSYTTTTHLLTPAVMLGHMMKSIFALAEIATVLVQYCFIKYVNCKEKLQRVHH